MENNQETDGQRTTDAGGWMNYCLEAERERDEARAIAKFWQEQYGHANPDQEWESFPWEGEI